MIQRRCLAMVVGLLLVGSVGGALAFQGPQEFYDVVSATDENTTVTFGFLAAMVVVVNDGPNTAHFTVSATTATTDHFALPPGASVSLTLANRTQGGAIICATGETASVRVWAVQ